MARARPLRGVGIVDLTSLLPGGFATRLLADLGAEVIRVEPPGVETARRFPPLVDGLSFWYRMTMGKKRIRFLDLKTPGGRAALERLLEKADVLIHSLRREAARRLGRSSRRVSRRHPRLVQVAITGYRHSNRAGHDLNFFATSGLLDLNRAPNGLPVIPRFQAPDVAGGAWPAVAAVLTGLIERGRRGRAAPATISVHEGSLALLSYGAAEYLATGRISRAGALVSHEGHPCYGLYPTKDGRLLAVACIEAKFWRAFCEAIDVPGLIPLQYAQGPAGRRARRLLEAATRRRTFREWSRFLERLDVCVTPVASVPEAIERQRTLEPSRGVFRPSATGRGELVPRIR